MAKGIKDTGNSDAAKEKLQFTPVDVASLPQQVVIDRLPLAAKRALWAAVQQQAPELAALWQDAEFQALKKNLDAVIVMDAQQVDKLINEKTGEKTWGNH